MAFPAVIGADTRILILGSMPGVASLDAQQYYAHPQNHFWRIMGEICGAGPALPYRERLQALLRERLGLWDVLQSCVRGGSLDAAIEHHSAIANDLLPLLRRSADIIRLCCNGGTAYMALRRHFGASLARDFPQIWRSAACHRPARPMPAGAIARKLEAWSQALRDR